MFHNCPTATSLLHLPTADWQRRPSLSKPLMHIAFSPYFSNIYKFPPIFITFHFCVKKTSASTKKIGAGTK